MKEFRVAIASFLAGSLVLASSASADNQARLLTFDTLEKRLGEPGIRILDARPKADYDSGHIPGAVWVDAKAVEEMAAKPEALNDRASWEKWLGPLGIGPNTEVVVYDAKRQLDAARLWWLLGYLGVERVALLDGNFPLWASEKRPVTRDVPTVEVRPFAVSFRKDRHATRDEVLSAVASKSAVVVAARTDGEYVGTDRRSQRAVHIPAACSMEWTNLVDKEGRFLGESTLRSKLAKAGVKEGEPVIAHCQGGGRASVDAFVLERLGFKTRNYYHGWSDWGNASDTPVEMQKGDEPRE